MAALSLTLAFSIPVLMDKVMRPRYEARFEEFRRYNRSQLFAALETAMERLRRLKRSSELMTPEDYAAMEGLVARWTLVKENETKKDTLLRRRKHLFVGWLISVGLSTTAIEYPDALVAGALNITFGTAATAAFFIMLIYSAYYGWQIYDLDDKLSKFGGTISKQSEFPDSGESEDSVLEKKISYELARNKIRFGHGGLIRTNEGAFAPDFVIPSVDDPRYFVEVKSVLPVQAGYQLASYAKALKSKYPASKMLLIARTPTKAMVNFLLSRGWDGIFDVSNLDRFISVVRAG